MDNYMDRDKLLQIVTDTENKSNKELNDVLVLLEDEFNDTKKMILDLTNHMDVVEIFYKKISEEIKTRLK